MSFNISNGFREYERHINPVLAQFLKLSGRGQLYVRAEGCALITDSGEQFNDWIAGFGSMNLGHNPPELRDLIHQHLSTNVPNLYPESLNPFSGSLGAALVKSAGKRFETCFFSNSGSEAVEAAIKTAIAATGKKGILYCDRAYHGTTMGALSLMGSGHFREKFEPLLPYVSVPFNNIEGLAVALQQHEPAAFIVEPIQVDGGVRIPNPDFLQQASSLCHDFGALLVLDEVQTGMGRTGTLFAFQQMDVTPDILVIGKSLGGGLLPIGATLYGEGIFHRAYGNYLSCEVHNSTFGGNTLACRVASEVLNRISNDNFLQQVRSRSDFLGKLLQEKLRNHSLVLKLSLRGLLGGLTLREVEHPWFSWKSLGLDDFDSLPVTGPLLVHRLHRKKFLTQICAHDWNTLRIEPPLIVSEAECEKFVLALEDELNWIVSNS